jgi:hypothetical protein
MEIPFLSISLIPSECLTKIFEKLDFHSIENALLVCKQWREVAEYCNIFKALLRNVYIFLTNLHRCYRDFAEYVQGNPAPYDPGPNPKEIYLYSRTEGTLSIYDRPLNVPVSIFLSAINYLS